MTVDEIRGRVTEVLARAEYEQDRHHEVLSAITGEQPPWEETTDKIRNEYRTVVVGHLVEALEGAGLLGVSGWVRTIPELHALAKGTVVRDRGGWVSVLAEECLEDGRVARMAGLEDDRVLLDHHLPLRIIDLPHVMKWDRRRPTT